MQLFKLGDDLTAAPVTWGEYAAWEDSIPSKDRCDLGMILRHDYVNGIAVVTLFTPVSLGLHHRRGLNWFTIAAGQGFIGTSLYSSHRAAANSGHSRWVGKAKKNGNVVPQIFAVDDEQQIA